MWLSATRTLTILLEDWSYSDQNFDVTDASGKVLGVSAPIDFYKYQLTFIPPADGYYDIRPFADDRSLYRR